MFERFTAESRQVLCRAQEHAVGLGHDWIGCEHLLLAAADAPDGVGALLRQRGATAEVLAIAVVEEIGCGPVASNDKDLLASLGIDADAVRHAAEATFGSGALGRAAVAGGRRHRLRRLRAVRSRCSNGLPFTPRAKRCLELSLQEALRRKHGFIGSEHIGLALLARDDTVAWRVLLRVGVRPDELHRALDDTLRRTA